MTKDQINKLDELIQSFLGEHLGEPLSKGVLDDLKKSIDSYVEYIEGFQYRVICDETNNPPDIVDQNMIVFRLEEVRKDWPAKRVDGIIYV